jgi:hypothetical protein
MDTALLAHVQFSLGSCASDWGAGFLRLRQPGGSFTLESGGNKAATLFILTTHKGFPSSERPRSPAILSSCFVTPLCARTASEVARKECSIVNRARTICRQRDCNCTPAQRARTTDCFLNPTHCTWNKRITSQQTKNLWSTETPSAFPRTPSRLSRRKPFARTRVLFRRRSPNQSAPLERSDNIAHG